MAQGFQSETLPKLLSLLRAPTHHHRHIVGLEHAGQYRRRQIAAWAHAMPSSLEETDHIRQKMAVQKYVSSLRVHGAKLRIAVMTDHMIDVGRNHIAEPLTPECRQNCARLAEFVVVNSQDVVHVMRPAVNTVPA